MGQNTSGVRRILSIPLFYDAFQDLVGASGIRKRWIRDFLKPFPGARLLDIGCGTSEILRFLPDDVDYAGFDRSPEYIEAARSRYGGRGRFTCGDVEAYRPGGSEEGGYDIAMAFGVLHHLDDGSARQLFQSARTVLKAGGRLVTIDPVFLPDQNPLARYMVSRDRGRNVRHPESYAALAQGIFAAVEPTVLRNTLRIPYDHAVLVCRP